MKTIPMHIRFTTIQVVYLSGKSVFSVEKVGEYLEVVRKRYRGSFFDRQFVAMDKVVSFSPGENEKNGTAYAIIYDEVLLKEIRGQGVLLENDFARIVDESSVTHEINLKPNVPGLAITLSEPKFKEIELEEKRVPRKPKVREQKIYSSRSSRVAEDDHRSRRISSDEKSKPTIVRGKRDRSF